MPDPRALTEREIVTILREAGCVFAEDEARLILAENLPAAALSRVVDDRAAGTPLEHLLGWVEFFGRRIAVGPHVFVPRRRTELIVTEALAVAARDAVVVELCSGCAAVATVVAAHLVDAEVHAADLSPDAVASARRNLDPARVHRGDLYDALPVRLRGRVDVLVANAPYVPTDALALMPREARDFEPRVAHDGGADGLDLARRIAADAPRWLVPGGHLIVETSERQAPALAAAFDTACLTSRIVHDDDLDATVVVGRARQ